MMTPDVEAALRAFHRSFYQAIPDKPSLPDDQTKWLRIALICEEYGELFQALAWDDIPGVADACVDLVYVVVGTAISYGLPFNQLFADVHAANMRKRTGYGATYHKGGKVQKPPGWVGPNTEKILEAHGWEGPPT